MSEKMKMVYHNPHAIWFKENISCHFLDVKSISKYNYIFDHSYNSKGKVIVLIDHSSRAKLFAGIFRFFNSPIIDFYAWVILNRLNPFKFKIKRKAEELDSDHIIFSFLYGSFTYANAIQNKERQSLIEDFKKSSAIKIAHLTHYGYSPILGSSNASAAQIDFFVGEANVSANSLFFQQYFSWYKKDTIILPFVPQARFRSFMPFKKRINKALSTGTNTHEMSDNEFVTFFRSKYLQPMRKTIIDNSGALEAYVDSLISNIQPETILCNITGKPISPIKSYLSKVFDFLIRDFYRIGYLAAKYFFNLKRKSLKKERDYYKIDIVEKYNKYKMFIVPEEVIGVPGIGFVEGMACGSAYLGVRNQMYSDLGLIDKVHYIGYDGTLTDLINKIEYYQINSQELEKIAENGMNFVLNNFNSSNIVENFYEKLAKIHKNKLQWMLKQ